MITGASRPEQVEENLGALDVLPLMTEELRTELVDLARAARRR